MSIEDRSLLLLGEEKLDKLRKAKVVVIGLGGVGGSAAEALARSSLGEMVLIDGDEVDPSNLNRQLLYTQADVGNPKSLTAGFRLKSINPDLKVATLQKMVDEEFFSYADFTDASYVVDAIDDVQGKLAIAKYCLSHDVPLIVSLGMANRLDPGKVRIMKLNQTYNDPLAKKLRHVYREVGLDISKITVAASIEEPLVRGVTPASMMMVPSSAGLTIAYHVISALVNK
ncbi:MAG: ThiF family adenylyltransferase [Bacillota bacterium]|nr:ThiF family adenylyltransferase [Bacillota bacterium]